VSKVAETALLAMAEDPRLSALFALDKSTQEEHRAITGRLEKVQFTPVEGQVAFIKEIIKTPDEAKIFLANPKQYAVDHGILIDPQVVKKVVNQVLFDTVLDEEFCGTAGIHVTKDIIDLRDRLKPGGIKPVGPGGDPVNPVANAAVVAAAAAVAVAVVEVVTMVVTLVRAKRPADLVSLQGLGEKGIMLPGNISFQNRGRIGGISAVRGAGGIR